MKYNEDLEEYYYEYLALNSNAKSPNTFLKIPVSVPLPELREPE